MEPAGHGIESGEHGAPLGHAKVGIYFGMKSPLMQTEDGQVEESYSISAGLDFPSVWTSTCVLAKYWSCRIPKYYR